MKMCVFALALGLSAFAPAAGFVPAKTDLAFYRHQLGVSDPAAYLRTLHEQPVAKAGLYAIETQAGPQLSRLEADALVWADALGEPVLTESGAVFARRHQLDAWNVCGDVVVGAGLIVGADELARAFCVHNIDAGRRDATPEPAGWIVIGLGVLALLSRRLQAKPLA